MQHVILIAFQLQQGHFILRMFGLRILGISCLAASPNHKFAFQDARLQMAVDIFYEAQDLVTDGKHKEACEEFMSGISIGRSIVQRLQDTQDGQKNTDSPESALDWLVLSYISMFRARVEIGDWETARADAWAACNYSMYMNIEALYCMLSVCQNTDDKIGELQTLKSILAASTVSNSSRTKDSNVDSEGDGTNQMTIEEVHDRIRFLEGELLESK